jgi:hypothetical protein
MKHPQVVRYRPKVLGSTLYHRVGKEFAVAFPVRFKNRLSLDFISRRL